MSAKESSGMLTFGMIHGSWHGPESWDLVRGELEAHGHQVIVVNGLPTQDPHATRADHARVAANQLSGQRIDLLAAHSGGAQIVPDVLKLLGNTVSHVAYISGSFGNPAPDSLAAGKESVIPRQRSSDGFRNGIVTLSDGMTIFDASAARELFYNDLPPEEAELAVRSLHPQYRLEDQPPPIRHPDPATYILGEADRVRNPDWAKAIAQALGMRLIRMAGGHCPLYSQPRELAQVLMRLAVTTPEAKTSPIPTQRKKRNPDEL